MCVLRVIQIYCVGVEIKLCGLWDLCICLRYLLKDLSWTIEQNDGNGSKEKNSLRVFEVNGFSDWVLLDLVLREAFLIERHLEVAMLLTQEALQV